MFISSYSKNNSLSFHVPNHNRIVHAWSWQLATEIPPGPICRSKTSLVCSCGLNAWWWAGANSSTACSSCLAGTFSTLSGTRHSSRVLEPSSHLPWIWWNRIPLALRKLEVWSISIDKLMRQEQLTQTIAVRVLQEHTHLNLVRCFNLWSYVVLFLCAKQI